MNDTSQGPLRRRRDAEGTDWHDRAACRDVDPDLFFPIGTSGASLLQTEEAKQICRTCPVCGPCLRWAFDSGATGVCGHHQGEAAQPQATMRSRTVSIGISIIGGSTVAASRNSAGSASRRNRWSLAAMTAGPRRRNRRGRSQETRAGAEEGGLRRMSCQAGKREPTGRCAACPDRGRPAGWASGRSPPS
jgi:WhiB family transcriptional regulator, redox-sensing transcriptional regulator